jgi:MYXO-CTERM domain-containing protein
MARTSDDPPRWPLVLVLLLVALLFGTIGVFVDGLRIAVLVALALVAAAAIFGTIGARHRSPA